MGSLQVCASQEPAVKSALHSMVDILECDESTSIVQIDAASSFNSLNRNVFLNNIKILYLEFATLVFNCYPLPSRLFIRGGSEIKPQQVTTQGDPIAMGYRLLE